jgi:MoxR-like ATPase
VIEGIRRIQDMLESQSYITDRAIATTVYLAMELRKPVLIEGQAGVGKTEIAKVLSRALDTALYEWNYPKQMLRIRMEEGGDKSVQDREEVIFSEPFLLKRPLLQAISAEKAPVLLIDEIDRADEEFEAFLLEVLSDFQVTIPELGTVTAEHRPYVVLTSNRTRELSDALKRRCLYLWIDFPAFDKELRIITTKIRDVDERLAQQITAFMQGIRKVRLAKIPGVAETLDWASSLMALHQDHLDPESVRETLGAIFKDRDDVTKMSGKSLDSILDGVDTRTQEELEHWIQSIGPRMEKEFAGR